MNHSASVVTIAKHNTLDIFTLKYNIFPTIERRLFSIETNKNMKIPHISMQYFQDLNMVSLYLNKHKQYHHDGGGD